MIEIMQLLPDREQMLLLYYNKSAREYRLMTLKAPDTPLVEENLCARLYATISSICSWFISFWQRLWHAALG